MTDPAYPGSILSLTNHEIYIVTASHEGRENGQIATWVLPATLVPEKPRVVIILSPRNYTHSLIEASGRFVLNLLAEDQHDLVPLFGLASGREIDKFDGVALGRTARGLPLIPDTCGWMECVTVASLDGGDRRVYVAEIVEQSITPGRVPLRKNVAFSRLPADVRHLLEEKHRNDGRRDSGLIRPVS